ncbi:MAG TPA: DNA gyrase modulator, partial [Acidimicrobiales bacterium]|nr:DNA gyrase modulator [Acidimicrobiales bacterium]
MFELAEAAVEGALAAGATYADARAMVTSTEGLSARNGVLEGLSQNESAGVGVRALLGSSWGFFATPDHSVAAASSPALRAAAT